MRRSIMFKRVFVLLLVLGLTANASAGLVASYDMEEGSGTTMGDATTNNYDGTLDGTYTPGWTTDAAGGSYSIDMSTDNSSAVDMGTWDPAGTDGAFGISLWYKWLGNESWWDGIHGWQPRGQSIVQKRDGWNDNDMTFMLFVGGEPGELRLYRPASRVSWDEDANELALMKQDQWAFLELYYDGAGEVSLRVDGSAWYPKSWTPGNDTTAMVSLGGSDTTNYSFNGYLDDVKFYDTIPEPTTIALLGLGGLLLRRRRR
jgi:hypothetical protein